jgi:hypothetical protein
MRPAERSAFTERRMGKAPRFDVASASSFAVERLVSGGGSMGGEARRGIGPRDMRETV